MTRPESQTDPRTGTAADETTFGGGQAVAIVLLVITGAMIAGMLASAEAARAAGAETLATVVWQAVGGGAVLALIALPYRPRIDRTLVTYGVLSGLTAIAIPNLLLFWLLAEISAGRVATALAATPVMTALIAWAWQGKPLGALGWVGILVGTAGVALLTGAGTPGAIPLYALLTLGVVTLSLSFGNVYRTVKWPEGAAIPTLAAAMKLGVGVPLALVLLAVDPAAIVPTADTFPAAASMVAFSVLAYLAFYALQRHGGPVVLSLVGGVIAFVGGMGDWVLAGLPPGLGFVPGLALLAVGVLLVSRRPRTG